MEIPFILLSTGSDFQLFGLPHCLVMLVTAIVAVVLTRYARSNLFPNRNICLSPIEPSSFCGAHPFHREMLI